MNPHAIVETGKHWLRRTRLFSWCRRSSCILQTQALLRPVQGALTSVIFYGGDFNQSMLNAATICDMGCRQGFEALRIPNFLDINFYTNLALDPPSNPVCWITKLDLTTLWQTI